MTWYTFQESKMWDSTNTYPSARKKTVQGKSVEEARKKLPRPSRPGRIWLLVDPKEE